MIANSQQPTANSQQPTANSQHMTSKTYQTLKYFFIAISSIAILNCGNSSSGTTVPNGEPKPIPSNYKFQNGVAYGVDFETDSGKSGTISSEDGFTSNEGDEKITFKIKDLIIGEINIKDINADKILLVSDVVGVERDDTVNKDVLKILRVLHSLDNDNDSSNGIFIDDDTKNKLVNLSEGKTKITENTIAELKALMVKAGKTLVVEKKARDYYKENVLTPAGITPKFNPFTIEVSIPSTNKSFIFGVSESFPYDYTVDWGDGSIDKNITKLITHDYTDAKKYTIKVTGNFPLIFLNISEKIKVVQVLAWGDIAWKSFYSAFNGVNAVGFKTTDTPDLSKVTSMQASFANSKITDIAYINDWDVSTITDMNAMFGSSKQFNGNISNWDVSNVTNMTRMFSGASSFNQDISAWNVSKVNNMERTFAAASIFNQDISKWNVSKVTSMSGLFASATNFDQNISAWNVSSVTTMASMFSVATNFNQDLSAWNEKVSNVTKMTFMFLQASKFNQDLSGWNVTNVTQYGGFANEWGGNDNFIPLKFR